MGILKEIVRKIREEGLIKESAPGPSIMDKKIKNPETGREVKIKTALGYDDNKQVKIKALALVKKNGGGKEEEVKDDAKIPEKQAKKVVAILDKLKSMADEAKEKGEEAPDYDLCKVSVPGSNLFCQVNLNVPRQQMPQLKGFVVPGSIADKLPKDKSGEVDTEPLFKKALVKSGYELKPGKVNASTLKATQSQLVGAKVAGMTAALLKDPNHPAITAPIFVSKDGYILDGHHRWAAMVGLGLNKNKDIMMNVIEVDMEGEDLVSFTNKFCDKIGIKQKAGKIKESIKLSNLIKLIESKTGKKLSFK